MLQMERLDLAGGDDHLDVGDSRRQLLDLRPPVAGLLEVRPHTRGQRLRLADVEDVAAGVAAQVDARLRRQRLELFFHPVGHGLATVAKRMVGTRAGLAAMLGAALFLAPAAHTGGPGLVIGATDDIVRAPTLVDAKAEMALVQLAGFRAVRITQTWAPGETTESASDAAILRNVTAAAQLSGVKVLTSILNAGSATTPLSASDQADFAAYAASVVRTDPALTTVIVGNEPNLNRYWLPQFNVDGSDAAAPAYKALLAAAYEP